MPLPLGRERPDLEASCSVTTTRPSLPARALLRVAALGAAALTVSACSPAAAAHDAAKAATSMGQQAQGQTGQGATVAALTPGARLVAIQGHARTTGSMPTPGSCHLRFEHGQPLPDPACTPGARDAAVTQANIHQTICVPGWTKTVRPPVSVTDKIKAGMYAAYGLPRETAELDHLVSLELGGAPNDTRNLWNEPGSIPNPKDHVENSLRKAVCAPNPRITLAHAQQAIATDWTTALSRYGLR